MCPYRVPLLLVTQVRGAAYLARTLEESLSAVVTVAGTARDGLEQLQRQRFRLLLVEEAVCSISSAELDALFSAAEGTPVLEVNFALSNHKRIARQVRGALRRQVLEERRAELAASQALRNALSGATSGLLLQAELLATKAEPPLSGPLQELVKSAEFLSRLLRTGQAAAPRENMHPIADQANGRTKTSV